MTDAPDTTANILDKPDLHIRPDEIAQAFGRKPHWFKRERAALYARGFPQPISKGVWLREEVAAFIRNPRRRRRTVARKES